MPRRRISAVKKLDLLYRCESELRYRTLMNDGASDLWRKVDATLAAPLVTGPLVSMFSGACLATIFAIANAISAAALGG